MTDDANGCVQMALARAERAAIGQMTVTGTLPAAERCRLVATPDRHLDEGGIKCCVTIVHLKWCERARIRSGP